MSWLLIATTLVCIYLTAGQEEIGANRFNQRLNDIEQQLATLIQNNNQNCPNIDDYNQLKKQVGILQSTVKGQHNTIQYLKSKLSHDAAFESNNTTPRSRNESRRLLFEEGISFLAVKKSNQANIGVRQNIVFDQIVNNRGGGYQSDHGLFVAPASGVYIFATTLVHAGQSQAFHAEIAHSGNTLVKIHGESSVWDSGSQTVVLQVNAGEEVWVRNIDYDNENVYGDSYSSFTGAMIAPL
ncbi:caprin-2-like [Dreissena polymorpha]|uniref:caprin-2-like n=1 Tax=Dreissena polymorpha TaxID=45954 RepID=UPI0022655570|nr:caprin-2-like [Dreissena polymorpha]